MLGTENKITTSSNSHALSRKDSAMDMIHSFQLNGHSLRFQYEPSTMNTLNNQHVTPESGTQIKEGRHGVKYLYF